MATITKKKVRDISKALKVKTSEIDAIVSVSLLNQSEFDEKLEKKSKRPLEKLEKGLSELKEKEKKLRAEYKDSMSSVEDEALVETVSDVIKLLKIKIPKDEPSEKASISERLNLSKPSNETKVESSNSSNDEKKDFNKQNSFNNFNNNRY